jgi:hypothetical protein
MRDKNFLYTQRSHIFNILIFIINVDIINENNNSVY